MFIVVFGICCLFVLLVFVVVDFGGVSVVKFFCAIFIANISCLY